ncbi:putative carotene oxygenase [Hesseltinella vesiculosa]|uniref:Putative carotene oxygenase n=1 Tax=Hesseltinella vesiculosa TaxID=101127 RepID=A0A1X2GDF5_9FUNG|nr:putative carotene oxygenase [Hesseltinella vesiculosa]
MTSVKTTADQNPTPGQPAPSPFGFKNVPAIDTLKPLQVLGTIPSWVEGVMYRAGAGKYNILGENGDTYHITHPFDGLAMLHMFQIKDNRIWYRSRHTSSGLEKRIQDRDPTLLTFGPDPCKTIFGRMQSFFCHLTGFGTDKEMCEKDPEYELVNVTVTPNFPIGPMLEAETGVARGEALVVKRDANTLQLVHRDTLRPLKKFTYAHVSQQLQGQLCASHHQYDEIAGDYVNFMVTLAPSLSFQPFSIRHSHGEWASKVRTFQPITQHLGKSFLPSIKPSYIHSFSMSEHFVIIPHFPYYYSYGGLSALYYNNAYQTFYWDANRNTVFHVVDRRSGRHVASYESDPCFSFHSINAFDRIEVNDRGVNERVIYLDFCMYENADIIDASFSLGKGSDGQDVDLDRVAPARFVRLDKHTDNKLKHEMKPSEVRRFRLANVPDYFIKEEDRDSVFAQSYDPAASYRHNRSPPKEYRVATYQVLGLDVELPRINPKFNLKPYRYVWGVCESKFAPSYTSGTVVNALIKMDLGDPSCASDQPHDDTDAATVIWDEPGCNCSEPIFLPRPDAQDEDDGVVLSIVNRSSDCFLLVLDGSTMTELARATIGDFNAMTIHGSFVDSQGQGVAIN